MPHFLSRAPLESPHFLCSLPPFSFPKIFPLPWNYFLLNIFADFWIVFDFTFYMYYTWHRMPKFVIRTFHQAIQLMIFYIIYFQHFTFSPRTPYRVNARYFDMTLHYEKYACLIRATKSLQWQISPNYWCWAYAFLTIRPLSLYAIDICAYMMSTHVATAKMPNAAPARHLGCLFSRYFISSRHRYHTYPHGPKIDFVLLLFIGLGRVEILH